MGASNAHRLVAVFVADPDSLSPSGRELMELFGWTPGETRLVFALMGGRSVQEVAADFDISIATARRQLRSIYRRAGVTSHADLLRAVHSITVGDDGLAIHADPAILPRMGRENEVDLTSREAEILRWMKDGKTNAEIAAILSISARTVEFHLGNVMRKLGSPNRTSAVVTAMRRWLPRSKIVT